MSRQKKLSDKPIATVLSPEDEARFEAERLRRGITRSELAREKISFQLAVEAQLTESARSGEEAGRKLRERLENDA